MQDYKQNQFEDEKSAAINTKKNYDQQSHPVQSHSPQLSHPPQPSEFDSHILPRQKQHKHTAKLSQSCAIHEDDDVPRLRDVDERSA